VVDEEAPAKGFSYLLMGAVALTMQHVLGLQYETLISDMTLI
jgi:hypothetical protein